MTTRVGAERGGGGRLLTAAEVAARLGVKPETVRRLTASGRLPCLRPFGTRTLRYREVDVEALANPAGGAT